MILSETGFYFSMTDQVTVSSSTAPRGV